VLARFSEARQRLSAARLYVVSADAPPGRQAEVLCAAIDGGTHVVQLRNKHAPPSRLLAAARQVAAHARAHGAVFIINDEPDLVEASGADGVHLGQEDGELDAARRRMPEGALTGRSTHSLPQAEAAVAEGADYIGVGPVHATPTKPGRPAVGLGLLRAVAVSVELPWFAIGGVDPTNLDAVLAAGAQRVAVVRAVAAAADPASAAAGLLAALPAPPAGVPA
jgi:thiamine-phosphate pyrophosphorylase